MKLSVVKAVLGCLFIVSSIHASADTISLKVPQFSTDGSYVLRVESELGLYDSVKQGKQLEIFRNKDGGEFRRILVSSRFSKLSELVRESGLYGYKVRWVSADSAHFEAEPFSEPVYIQVSSSVPRVPPSRGNRIASNGETWNLGVY